MDEEPSDPPAEGFRPDQLFYLLIGALMLYAMLRVLFGVRGTE